MSARIWRRDASVWTNSGEEKWLGWLDSAEHTAFTGSGNNDSQTVKRLKPEAWVVLEKLLHGDVDEPQVVLSDATAHLSYDLFFAVIAKVPPNPQH